MDFKIKTSLQDFAQCIQEINDFTGEISNFEAYKKDVKTQKAVERNLEIIGEAESRILKFDGTFEIKNARKIIGTRNRIIHTYDSISDEVVWIIIKRELPLLHAEINVHLSKD